MSGQARFKRHWQPDLRADYFGNVQSSQCQLQLKASLTAADCGNVQAAFQSLHTAIGQAADVSGMTATSRQSKPCRTPNKPFFDRQCAQLKRQVQRAPDPITRKALERRYHSLVRSKRRKYLQQRLQDLIAPQYSNPRGFWKLPRQEHAKLPLSLQAVQLWDQLFG